MPGIESEPAETSQFGKSQSIDNLVRASLYGLILPAIRPLMLALRSRDLRSPLARLRLIHEEESARLMGIPDNVVQTVLIPIAYYTGTYFQPAK